MSRIFPRALLPLLAVFAALFVAPGQSTAIPGGVPIPSADPFYTPPNSLPSGVPGDVPRHRKFRCTPNHSTSFPCAVNAWQMLYRSTSATGTANAVSGTLLRFGGGTRPRLSQAVGTTRATPCSTLPAPRSVGRSGSQDLVG